MRVFQNGIFAAPFVGILMLCVCSERFYLENHLSRVPIQILFDRRRRRRRRRRRVRILYKIPGDPLRLL